MKITLSKSQWEQIGKTAGWRDRDNDIEENKSISVPVSTLQGWALSLAQGDNTPRWAIEDLLKKNGFEPRSSF